MCSATHLVWLFVITWAVAHQIPLSMEISKQEYWSGFLLPSLGVLPDPGIEPESPASPALAGGFLTTVPPRKPCLYTYCVYNFWSYGQQAVKFQLGNVSISQLKKLRRTEILGLVQGFMGSWGSGQEFLILKHLLPSMISCCISDMTLLTAFLRQIWDIVWGIFWVFVMKRFPVGC